jgi:molybdopterin-guanine dinucleotide biosynthesis protein A
MPLLNKDFVRYLASSAGGFDAVVPRVGPHLEPLHAVYSKRCIMEIKELLVQDKLKVDGLFDRVRTRFIGPAEIDRFDEAHLCFMNINTPADLVKAEGLLGRS